MGNTTISLMGCVASIVLLLQLGLHTQLLQRRSVQSLENLTEEETNQYSSTLMAEPSSRILRSISKSGRNKRFLENQGFSDEVNLKQDSGSVATSEEEKPVTGVHQSDLVVTSFDTRNSVEDPWAGVSPELKISNYYNGQFLLPNIHLCGQKSENLSLLVLVPSAISHVQQRNSVRKTWGTFALRKDVAVGFIVGNPNLSDADASELDSFQKEIDLFGDIVVADMKDSYKNLTLKVLYMLEWTSTHCSNARFFMKTDDDVFLNVPLVLDFISKIQEEDSVRPKIYGNVFSGHMPNRDSRAKHHVNRQIYPHEIHYPNFTSGPAYLVSSKVVRPLLKQAVHLPLFNLEDVFLTGFVASSLEIPRVNVTQFRNELENPFDMPMCKIVNTIAGMTDGSPPQIYYVWYNYLMGKVICKHLTKFNR